MPSVSAAPRACASDSPSPSLHGAARRSSPRSRASLAPNPPVARTTGSASKATSGSPSRTAPATRTSACVRLRGSKRLPFVRGFPVWRSTTDAPSRSSHSSDSSSRSNTSRCSSSSPPGHSARNSSSVRWRQIIPLESSIDPPGRSPFSSKTAGTPSSRRRVAATSPPIPAPATVTNELREREARLVLDVFELHALRAPDEDRIRIRRVDHVGNLRSRLFGALAPLVCGVDEDAEVVEKRAVGLARVARVQLEVGAGHFDPRRAVSSRGRSETEALPLARGLLRVGHSHRHVVEVVFGPAGDLHQRDSQPLRDLELLAEAPREGPECSLDVRHSQADANQGSRLPWAFSSEQRQLAPAGVPADQREAIRALDLVHTEVPAGEIGDLVAVGDPERHVVEAPELHA